MASINPPWRFDPLQMPVNVSWGNDVYVLLQLYWSDFFTPAANDSLNNYNNNTNLATNMTFGFGLPGSQLGGWIMSTSWSDHPEFGIYLPFNSWAGPPPLIGYWSWLGYYHSGTGQPYVLVPATVNVSFDIPFEISTIPNTAPVPVAPFPSGMTNVVTMEYGNSDGVIPALYVTVLSTADVYGMFTGAEPQSPPPDAPTLCVSTDDYAAATILSGSINFEQFDQNPSSYNTYTKSVVFRIPQSSIPADLGHPLLLNFTISGTSSESQIFPVAWQATIIPTKDHVLFPSDPVTLIRWNTPDGQQLPFCLFQINGGNGGTAIAQVSAINPPPPGWAGFFDPKTSGGLLDGAFTLAIATGPWTASGFNPLSGEREDATMIWVQNEDGPSFANMNFALAYKGAQSWTSGANGFNDPTPANMVENMLGFTFPPGAPPSFTPPFS